MNFSFLTEETRVEAFLKTKLFLVLLLSSTGDTPPCLPFPQA